MAKHYEIFIPDDAKWVDSDSVGPSHRGFFTESGGFSTEEIPESNPPGGSTPQQYALPDGAVELQDLIEYRDMNYAVANIFKACFRLGHCEHSDKIRDLNKILWFAERELKRIKESQS